MAPLGADGSGTLSELTCPTKPPLIVSTVCVSQNGSIRRVSSSRTALRSRINRSAGMTRRLQVLGISADEVDALLNAAAGRQRVGRGISGIVQQRVDGRRGYMTASV